jgi:hypothetical protein
LEEEKCRKYWKRKNVGNKKWKNVLQFPMKEIKEFV